MPTLTRSYGRTSGGATLSDIQARNPPVMNPRPAQADARSNFLRSVAINNSVEEQNRVDNIAKNQAFNDYYDHLDAGGRAQFAPPPPATSGNVRTFDEATPDQKAGKGGIYAKVNWSNYDSYRDARGNAGAQNRIVPVNEALSQFPDIPIGGSHGVGSQSASTPYHLTPDQQQHAEVFEPSTFDENRATVEAATKEKARQHFMNSAELGGAVHGKPSLKQTMMENAPPPSAVDPLTQSQINRNNAIADKNAPHPIQDFFSGVKSSFDKAVATGGKLLQTGIQQAGATQRTNATVQGQADRAKMKADSDRQLAEFRAKNQADLQAGRITQQQHDARDGLAKHKADLQAGGYEKDHPEAIKTIDDAMNAYGSPAPSGPSTQPAPAAHGGKPHINRTPTTQPAVAGGSPATSTQPYRPPAQAAPAAQSASVATPQTQPAALPANTRPSVALSYVGKEPKNSSDPGWVANADGTFSHPAYGRSKFQKNEHGLTYIPGT